MRKLITLLIIIVSFNANADGVGNGGDGVLKNGAVYLLDLVEIGEEKSPYFKDASNFDSRLFRVIQSKGIALTTGNLVAAKIREIESLSSMYAFMLKIRLVQLDWVFVNRSLKDIKDEDGVIEFNEGELVQLAVRQGHQVTIDKSLWDQMTPEHQAALVFHELNYSLLRYYQVYSWIKQNSMDARDLTATLFSDRFGSMTIEQFAILLDRTSLHQHTWVDDGLSKWYMFTEVLKSVIEPYVVITKAQTGMVFVELLFFDGEGKFSDPINWHLLSESDARIKRRDEHREEVPIFNRGAFDLDPKLFSEWTLEKMKNREIFEWGNTQIIRLIPAEKWNWELFKK